jgi:hypothetical protein
MVKNQWSVISGQWSVWRLRVRHLRTFAIFLAAISAGAQVIPTNLFDQLMATQPAIVSPPVVSATASFDPPAVVPGERAIYRVTINANEASVTLPEQIVAPPQLKIRKSTSGEIMVTASGGMAASATFNFDVRASEPGQFTVPEYVIEVYGKPVTVPAARLNVQTQLPQPHEPARQLLVEPSATNVFIGQEVTVNILFPGTLSNTAEAIMQLQLKGDGFIAGRSLAIRQPLQPMERNGRTVPTSMYETVITPVVPGDLTVRAQGFTAGMRFNGPIVITGGQVIIPGGPGGNVLVDSEPATIHVRPLPDSELPGFSGAIGSFILAAPRLSTNEVRVGDPVQLTAIVRGQGNLNRISPPPPPRVKGWQIFPAVRQGMVAEPGTANVGAGFSFTLVPMADNVRETPAIPFSCFDPERGQYVDLTIPSLPITVLPSETPVLNEFAAANLEADDTQKKASLSKLAPTIGYSGSLVPLQMRAWFPLVQVLPALVFCGLWLWDRRRRYLEQHPDIVRRRQARRALRRERRAIDRAIARGDNEGFVNCAVNAMRVASAPHFPAHPRALVCRDVLEVLNGAGQNGRAGEVVRKFFAAADDRSFGIVPQSHGELLNQKTEMEQVLSKLEARL